MIEKRFKWLINLRWLAACGVLIAGLFIHFFFRMPVPVVPLLGIALLLALLNLAYLWRYKVIIRKPERDYSAQERLAIVQIVADLVLLTLLLHYSGGVENPFIIYYVFHMMLAGILLPLVKAMLVTSFAIALTGLLAISEFMGWINHYPLTGFTPAGYYDQPVYLFGAGFVFITTSYVVVYMTSTVSALLRERERICRKTNEELLKKDRIKDEYVYRITHDIKGHLAAVKTCLDAGSSGLPAAQREHFSRRAYKRTKKLLDFVRELIRITRLRLNNEMSLTSFSLKELLKEIHDEYVGQLNDKKASFKLDLQHDILTADRLAIGEVFDNLIANSIRFIDEGGIISITSRLNLPNEILIQVRDNGIGISPEETDHIFQEFYRASNNAGRSRDGSGMGLAIARMIIEHHRGTIRVESKPKKGTMFEIRLPSAAGSDIAQGWSP